MGFSPFAVIGIRIGFSQNNAMKPTDSKPLEISGLFRDYL